MTPRPATTTNLLLLHFRLNSVTDSMSDQQKPDTKADSSGGPPPLPPPGGIASLLGSTASILGSTATREEIKPRFSLNPEDVERYQQAFKDFDHNKDGHISTNELMFAFGRA